MSPDTEGPAGLDRDHVVPVAAVLAVVPVADVVLVDQLAGEPRGPHDEPRHGDRPGTFTPPVRPRDVVVVDLHDLGVDDAAKPARGQRFGVSVGEAGIELAVALGHRRGAKRPQHVRHELVSRSDAKHPATVVDPVGARSRGAGAFHGSRSPVPAAGPHRSSGCLLIGRQRRELSRKAPRGVVHPRRDP